MTVTAEKVGRSLHLKFEGVEEPFIIKPLPGRAGLAITDTYLAISGGENRAQDLTQALQIAVDGAVREGDRWVPVAEDQQTNFNRIGDELSQDEAEAILMPAFFWQTILGMDGVKAYLEGGEGLSGTLRATSALARRLGFLVAPNAGEGTPA